MIAIRREEPGIRIKEDIYALRRRLVRRLQGATRGIPRRQRFQALRRFGEEWRERAVEGTLRELVEAVTLGARPYRQGRPLLEGESLLLDLALAVEGRPLPLRADSPTVESVLVSRFLVLGYLVLGYLGPLWSPRFAKRARWAWASQLTSKMIRFLELAIRLG